MRSQIASCRLALRRLEELFNKYGTETMLAAIQQIFTETEEKCRKIVAQIPDGVYEAESFYGRQRRAQGRPPRDQGQGQVDGERHDHRPFRVFAERKAAINSRTLAGARVAYKAMTCRSTP